MLAPHPTYVSCMHAAPPPPVPHPPYVHLRREGKPSPPHLPEQTGRPSLPELPTLAAAPSTLPHKATATATAAPSALASRDFAAATTTTSSPAAPGGAKEGMSSIGVLVGGIATAAATVAGTAGLLSRGSVTRTTPATASSSGALPRGVTRSMFEGLSMTESLVQFMDKLVGVEADRALEARAIRHRADQVGGGLVGVEADRALEARTIRHRAGGGRVRPVPFLLIK